MSNVMRLRLVSVVAVLSIAILGVGGCKIKYDSEKGADGAFNAKTYVEELWDSKAIPLMHTAPIDVGTVLAAIAKDPEAAGKEYGHRPGEGQPWSYLVKGEGAITSVDVASRHGTATLEVMIDNKPTKVILQIGPVIFGTALRDALPFIAFGDFVNQIDYAEVSRGAERQGDGGLCHGAGRRGRQGGFVRRCCNSAVRRHAAHHHAGAALHRRNVAMTAACGGRARRQRHYAGRADRQGLSRHGRSWWCRFQHSPRRRERAGRRKRCRQSRR